MARLTQTRIGILGAGAMATAHAAAYAGIAEATVVGVFSRDPARARWLHRASAGHPGHALTQRAGLGGRRPRTPLSTPVRSPVMNDVTAAGQRAPR